MWSSRPIPPSPSVSSKSQHNRSMKYWFIFFMSMVTDTAVAVLSAVEVTSDDTAAHDIALVGKTNIALNRPCRPAPYCYALIDNNQSTSATTAALHINKLANIGEATIPFQIFLKKQIAISDVIVVCKAGQHRDKSLRGTLLVTILSDGEGSLDANDGVLPGASKTMEQEMQKDIIVSNQSEMIKVAFRFDNAASAIKVQWRCFDQNESGCGLHISEVMVMTSNASEDNLSMTGSEVLSDIEGGDIMRIKSAWEKLSDESAPDESMDTDEANASSRTIASPPHADLVLNSSRSKMFHRQRHRTTLQPSTETTLAPAGRDTGLFKRIPFMQVQESAEQKWEQGHDGDAISATSFGYQFHIPVLLAVVLIGAVAAKSLDCQLCVRHKYQLAAQEDPEAALSGSDRSRSDIGCDLGRPNSQPLRCARRLRFLHRTPPTTESEPEEESEPLIPASALEHEASQPRPLTLGATGSSSARTPLRPENLNSRRVVLLYASPLCHTGQGGRPFPLPQIPFEKEWAVMLRAHDEAKTALRMSDGDSIKRQPGACLEAQPLTSASLRRLVAPSPDPTRGSAAVLHLSAHGHEDKLVVENGKTTAHFISSDLLQSMLADTATPAKLVVLNACSLRKLGDQFVNGGVPHVVCSSAELRDSASHVFLCAMYSSLFQGGTVAHAFRAALVALRSDPEESSRAAADYFHLLPELAAHDEVIFQPEVFATPNSVTRTRAAPSPAAALPFPLTPERESSGSSVGKATTRTGSSFLSSDVAESSTDGPDDSCCSEGHVDTSSNSGSHGSSRIDPSSESEDNHGDATEDSSLLLSNSSTSGPLLPLATLRRPRGAATAPARGSANTTSIARNRPNRSQLACKRRMPARRSATSCSLTQPEALLSPFGRAVPPLPEDFVGRTVDVWEVLQHLCDRRAVVVCGAPGTTHGIGKSALLDAVHRSFSFQMGGVCIPVHLKALCNGDVVSVASTWEWMIRVKEVVQSTFDEYLEIARQPSGTDQKQDVSPFAQRSSIVSGVCNGSAQALRRRITVRSGSHNKACSRSVSRGFHSLSDPVATRPVLEELVAVMSAFSEYCAERERALPASGRCTSGIRILLLLDECDHLIQQRHFQDAIAEVLRKCAAYSLVLSTQQQMVETGGGWFKVVHKQVAGLSPKYAAQLLLRRSHRPLYWDEIPKNIDSSNEVEDDLANPNCKDTTPSMRQQVVKTRENELEILGRIAAHPVIAAQQGNPRRLIEIASQLRDSLENLSDLAVAR